MGKRAKYLRKLCFVLMIACCCCAAFSGCKQSPKYLFPGWLGSDKASDPKEKQSSWTDWKVRVTANRIAKEQEAGRVQLGDVGNFDTLQTLANSAASISVRQVSNISVEGLTPDPFAGGLSIAPAIQRKVAVKTEASPQAPALPNTEEQATPTKKSKEAEGKITAEVEGTDADETPNRFASKQMIEVREQIESMRHSAHTELRNISRQTKDGEPISEDEMIVASNTVPLRIPRSRFTKTWDGEAIVVANNIRPLTVRSNDDSTLGATTTRRNERDETSAVSNANTGAEIQVPRNDIDLNGTTIETSANTPVEIASEGPVQRVRMPSKAVAPVSLSAVAFGSTPDKPSRPDSVWGYVLAGAIGAIGIMGLVVLILRRRSSALAK